MTSRDDQLRALVAARKELETQAGIFSRRNWGVLNERGNVEVVPALLDHLSARLEQIAKLLGVASALLASPPAPHDALLDAARAVDAAVRRTHNHTEWLEPLSRLMHAVEGTAASPPAPAQEEKGLCRSGARHYCPNCDNTFVAKD